MMFGGITIVCGILGTLAGGYILDCMDATISNAFKVNSVVSREYISLFVYFVLIYFYLFTLHLTTWLCALLVTWF